MDWLVLKGGIYMMTNKKLLDEIIEQTSMNNNELREQLKELINAVNNDPSRNIIADISRKYDVGINEIKHEINNFSDKIGAELNELSVKQTSENAALSAEYKSSLKELSDDVNDKIRSLSDEITCIGKALSDSIENIQKDNSIIMESIQIILTNILINGVAEK